MSLPERPSGSGGITITTLGFGSWAIGGGGWTYSWGPQDEETSIATVRHALNRGITWIDTAAVYGLGHSEEVHRSAAAAVARKQAAAGLHQMWSDLGREQPQSGAAPIAQAGVDSTRVRRVPATAGRAAHRSLSISLAR